MRGDAIAGVPRSHVLATLGPLVAYRVRGRPPTRGGPAAPASRHAGEARHDESYQDGASEYGPAATLGRLHLGIGGFVFFYRESGLESYAACTKYYAYPCSGRPARCSRLDVDRRVGVVDRFATDILDSSGADSSTTLTRVVVGAAPALRSPGRDRRGAGAAGRHPLRLHRDVRAGARAAPQVLATERSRRLAALHVATLTFTAAAPPGGRVPERPLATAIGRGSLTRAAPGAAAARARARP